MTISLGKVMNAFTPEQRARVNARAQKLIEEEVKRRKPRNETSPKPRRRSHHLKNQTTAHE